MNNEVKQEKSTQANPQEAQTSAQDTQKTSQTSQNVTSVQVQTENSSQIDKKNETEATKLADEDKKVLDEVDRDISLQALEEVEKLRSTVRELQLRLKREKVIHALEREGCIDPETALRLLELEKLEEDKINDTILQFKKQKPYFFQAPTLTERPVPLTASKPLSEMTAEEFAVYWNKLLRGQI